MKNRIILALTAFLLILCLSASVLAGPVPDKDRKCSITMNFRVGDQPVSGGSVSCIRVGYIQESDGKYSFVRLLDGKKMLNLSDPDTALELQRYAKQNNLTGPVKVVDKNGMVKFENLDTGVYLITQKQSFRPFSAG